MLRVTSASHANSPGHVRVACIASSEDLVALNRMAGSLPASVLGTQGMLLADKTRHIISKTVTHSKLQMRCG